MHSQGQIDAASAIASLVIELENWAEPEQQASVYFTIWQIDPSQTAVRDAAIVLYRDLYAKSSQIKYRKRFEQLTGTLLPEHTPLPLVEGVLQPTSISLESVMQQIEDWIDIAGEGSR